LTPVLVVTVLVTGLQLSASGPTRTMKPLAEVNSFTSRIPLGALNPLAVAE
jgi:hypothetical protein